jgi:sulfopyruvate decarboxylase subunit alpha
LTGDQFCRLAYALNYDFFTGVPDSTLKSVWKVLERAPRNLYVPSVREDNAVGMAVGAYLGGKNPVVLMQNSGLGHCLNALTSLVSPYRIPVLLIIGWRGAEASDSAEHILMGSASPAVLSAAGVPFWAPKAEDLAACMATASHRSRSDLSAAALLIREKVLD